MILVSGTKRSGTSMWMRALGAAGLPTIGTPFAAHWEQSIREANPNGFHESILRQGIFFATNPHPHTGRWMHPDSVHQHVVKVFVPGLVRTDFGYIDQVVGTMRDWREYGPSLARLVELEDRWLAAQPDGPERLRQAQSRRTPLPAPVDWFFENHELLRDVAIRRYPINLSSYASVLRDPEQVLRQVLGWLGVGDIHAAVKAIEPSLQTQRSTGGNQGMEPEHAALFDALYHAVDSNQPLSSGLLTEMNRVHAELAEIHGSLSPDRQREEELS